MSHYYFHQKLFYDSAHAYSSLKFKNRKIVPCCTVSQTHNINLILIFIVQGSMSRKSLDGQSNHTSVPEIDIKVCSPVLLIAEYLTHFSFSSKIFSISDLINADPPPGQ